MQQHNGRQVRPGNSDSEEFSRKGLIIQQSSIKEAKTKCYHLKQILIMPFQSHFLLYENLRLTIPSIIKSGQVSLFPVESILTVLIL